jgi:predicted glycogen debranching enzyme
LAKLEEQLTVGGRAYSLATNERPGKWRESGYLHLQRFSLEDGLPRFRYQVEDVLLDKKIALVHGQNTVVIGYEVWNGARPLRLQLRPLVNFRPYGEQSTRHELRFAQTVSGGGESGATVRLQPAHHKQAQIYLHSESGQFVPHEEPTFDDDMYYHYEIVDGKPGIDAHYVPGVFAMEVAAGAHVKFAVVCTLAMSGEEAEWPVEPDGWQLIAREEQRQRRLVEQAALLADASFAERQFLEQLVRAADHFIVERASTGLKTILAGYPWFADWGRDTMIALQGLALPTRRFQDARDILLTYARYVHNGLVPNMFPDEGQAPLYNTVDASMWYFHSVHEYLRYTGGADDYEFIRVHIYPVLREIIEAYKTGTDFSIGMDEDGLIAAGSGVDQVTWMDVRINGFVVTPRHGKPVEINALWYHALCVMVDLATRFGDAAEPYAQLAARVKQSFNAMFWNEADGCLFDVVSREGVGDRQIRPNQIWAVSLPHTMLPRERARAVVQTVWQKLYASYGLRSLDSDDAAYKPYYGGSVWDRDNAYHQGTVWSFPLGGFITAFCKVHDYSDEAVARARMLLEPLADHLRDGCIGQIAEIFDGHEPIISRGCYAQAWGVGEVLRAYVEDILWRGQGGRTRGRT